MNYFETEDKEINILREKIYNSNDEYKKVLLNKERVAEITKDIQKLPKNKIKKIINEKLERIKNGALNKEELQKIECELAVLITYLPIDYNENRKYWKEKEKYAKTKK